MPRYAKIITIDELKIKLEDHKNFATIPYKDFNLEIHTWSPTENIEYQIDGPIQKNNLVFAIVSVKSEWDTLPISFIAYIDEQNRLRAFLPKHGNTYNPWTATHFGSERAWEHRPKSITKMPDQYYELDKEHGGNKTSEQYEKEFVNMQPNKELMIKEFLRFVKVKDAA